MRSVFILFTLLSFLHTANAYDWTPVLTSSLLPAQSLTITGMKDIVGGPEFVSVTKFIPYDKDNKRVDIPIPIEFGTGTPAEAREGHVSTLSRPIPLVYIYNNSHMDLSKVKFFIVKESIYEKDFLSRQFVSFSKIILTPNGFRKYNSQDNTIYKKVPMQIFVNKKYSQQIQTQGRWELTKRKGSLKDQVRDYKERFTKFTN